MQSFGQRTLPLFKLIFAAVRQVCWVSASYCCAGAPLSASVPAAWPPVRPAAESKSPSPAPAPPPAPAHAAVFTPSQSPAPAPAPIASAAPPPALPALVAPQSRQGAGQRGPSAAIIAGTAGKMPTGSKSRQHSCELPLDQRMLTMHTSCRRCAPHLMECQHMTALC